MNKIILSLTPLFLLTALVAILLGEAAVAGAVSGLALQFCFIGRRNGLIKKKPVQWGYFKPFVFYLRYAFMRNLPANEWNFSKLFPYSYQKARNSLK